MPVTPETTPVPPETTLVTPETTLVTPELAVLSKRIAELEPGWARAGMACLDTQEPWPLWRCCDTSMGGAPIWYNLRLGTAYVSGSKKLKSTRSLLRAIASGPDCTDACTVLGLLSSARFTLSGGSGPSDAWLCELRGKPPHVAGTREEAILRAAVARLEALHAA